MQVRSALAVVSLVVSLAGCGDDGALSKPAADDPFSDLQVEVDKDSGLIRGVVVDQAIVPIPNVEVTLGSSGANELTDDQGRFVFAPVEPGTHFLRFHKLGYADLEQTTEVVAGVAQPPIIKVQLTRLPGTEPYIVPLQWDGFLACGFIVANAHAAGCLIGSNSPAGNQINDDSWVYDDVDGVPEWLQSELVWESTQTLGEKLCIRQYTFDGTNRELPSPDSCGTTPQVQTADGPRLTETGLGDTHGLERVVQIESWVDDDGTLGVVLEQHFSMFTHLFYNFTPNDAWLFVVDGAHPLPT